MNNYQVTVSLEFDVSLPVRAIDDDDVEDVVNNMSLSEFFDWATCASYSLNILEVRDDE